MYSASVFSKNKYKSPTIRVDLGLWCGVMCFGGRRVVLGHRDLSQGVWGDWECLCGSVLGLGGKGFGFGSGVFGEYFFGLEVGQVGFAG